MSTFRLITGGIGTGKSLWTVDKLFEKKKEDEDRKIYTDITGIQHTGIISVPPEFDWREAEDNSLIVFDEVQYKELFSRHNSKRDKQILDLTTIRKRGIELWVITQRARFLNPDVLGLVNEHIHLERNSKKSAKVFHFQEAETTITKAKKMFAFKKYVYQYPEHLYGFYESVKEGSVHHQRSWLHTGIIAVIITLVLAFIGIAITVYYGTKTGISSAGVEKPKESDKKPLKDQQLSEKNQSQQASTFDPNIECRKGINVEKPECVQWFDEKSKQNSNIPDNRIQQVSYDPNKPFDQHKIQETIQYEVTAKPVFSGCMKQGSKYIAYTQQGTKLNVTSEECRNLIENGDRPFNYFVQKEQNHDQILNQANTSQSDQSYVQKIQEEQAISTNPQVVSQPIPFGTKAPQFIAGAHSL